MQTRSGSTSPILNTELLREFLTSPDGIAILNAHRPSFDPVSTVDYTSKQIALFRYMATCLKSTKSQAYWASKYPTDSSIDLWYLNSSGILEDFPPGDIFATLSFVPPILPNDDQLAQDMFSNFKRSCPWSVHLKGFIDTDVNYLQTLTIYNGAHPIPLPIIDTSIKGVHFWVITSSRLRSPLI